MTLPVATKASSEVLSKAIDDAATTKSTYKLFYFALNGYAEPIRNLLAYGNVEFEDIVPEWPAMKKDTRFGYLPILYETTESGVVLEFSESQAIERYLARKFHLLGSNSWEEHLVNEYVNSIDTLWGQIVIRLLFSAVETRVQTVREFYKEKVAPWVQAQEGHLRANGSNGHYIGNKFTWADIKSATMTNILMAMVPNGLEEELHALINPTTTPALWRVRESARAHPSLGEWLRSEKHAQFTEGNKVFFKF